MSPEGIIFNIQRYSLHDGPGIRTVVFLKGCPLCCRWCCNPESQNPRPEISFYPSKCIGNASCGFCEKACDFDAIGFDAGGTAVIDRAKCTQCRRCAAKCPAKAIRTEGRTVTADQVIDEVEKEAVFYRGQAGGITISGGEPLAQGEFLLALLREAKRRRIPAAMETCGFGDYSVLRRAAPMLDTVLYDIKSLNDERHLQWTGQSNRIILGNFKRLCEDFPSLPKMVRTPVIPGFNDDAEEVKKILLYLHGRPSVVFEALPYHRFGVGKYAALGREYSVHASLKPAVMRQIESICKQEP